MSNNKFTPAELVEKYRNDGWGIESIFQNYDGSGYVVLKSDHHDIERRTISLPTKEDVREVILGMHA